MGFVFGCFTGRFCVIGFSLLSTFLNGAGGGSVFVLVMVMVLLFNSGRCGRCFFLARRGRIHVV